jgi:hypothetical protein
MKQDTLLPCMHQNIYRKHANTLKDNYKFQQHIFQFLHISQCFTTILGNLN